MADARALYAQVLPEYLPKLLAAEQAKKHTSTDFAIEVADPPQGRRGAVDAAAFSPRSAPDGRFIWNGVWTDITESVADRERLRQSEAMLRAMGDNLPESAVFRWTRGPDGVARYLYMSAGIEKLTGLAVEQVLADDGALLSQVLPEYRPVLAAADQKAQREVSDFDVKIPIRRADGEVRWVRLRSRPEVTAERRNPLERCLDGHHG